MQETTNRKPNIPFVVNDFLMVDIYKIYVKKTGNPYNLTQKKFSKVFTEFTDKVWNEIINNNYMFKAPFSLGRYYVKAYKQRLHISDNGELWTNKLVVDWNATRELRKVDEEARENKELVFVFNEHSDGMIAKIWWERHNSKLSNIREYGFRAIRKVKRQLAHKIKTDPITYYEHIYE